jgi:hypothetical protein
METNCVYSSNFLLEKVDTRGNRGDKCRIKHSTIFGSDFKTSVFITLALQG